IFLDVVGQRLERRDVQHARLVGQRAFEALSHQLVDGGKKGRERLAGAGGRGDEGVLVPANGGPGLGRDIGGAGELAAGPRGGGGGGGGGGRGGGGARAGAGR